ncbi:nickel/cobalt efflux transporter RcnA [Sphingomonas koreensis]|jgi:nickel/cobalt exporter|uniref:Nickel/cobalt efflux system n=3 Tax=Sphingomonadaceae TaxID=41297 RepID=A0A1L6J953_9SPHN|nr:MULTISPECIES: nickel/cobalt efflux transporter [Pseudomonadota]OJY69985.1 MAG: nickel/cobalt efflux protein RcnA [Sphingobium sp. 66-54]OYX47233.1 MAG: nickel/cobalt efflux protein RcnA [Sphingomonadales bacterium 32-64-22]QEH77868.1 nickel/cobalt efflux transporter RcnA [Sphingomonas sp. C8-2]APR52090.1 nickel/cobalt efflux protein RcnA [Sphingomonas koreensis]KAA9016900.1 nickel/cobalt efflux transporter RcnA [Sphingobium limneticum]|tara:strand:+ start:22814 stop:23689 length:876 start_codon:yes stop_codon:yes gene_type:complete
MTSLADLLQQSAAHAWLFVPTAILLGALHGLEPGHSKTMMAAFIIAVRGTVRQAVLLGLAATLSHTVVVWVVALGGMWLFGGLNAEATEPYFQLASGVLIVVIAAWMLWRTRREQIAAEHYHHDHGHHHGHSHGHGHNHHGDHDHHEHEEFEEAEERGLEVATGGFVDAHEMAHAEDIRRRFANSNVTTGQIILFGLTGGLIPCPGAITVLLLCLQLQRLALGAVLVLCFSIGLAITMVASGVIAAISVKQVTKRWSGFGEIVRKAPYVSGGVILIVGLYVAVHGWIALPH